jgi:hypothetical protein
MPASRENLVDRVTTLLIALNARAAGYWRVEGNHLEQLAFVPAATLPKADARTFAEATRTVSLDRNDLGIVQAALTGVVKVSRTSELPSDAGSGHWLRVFEAARSVAVPIPDATGAVRAILSVALPNNIPDDHAVADRLLELGQAWTFER